MGIYEGGRLWSCLLTRGPVRKASAVVMVSPGTPLVKNHESQFKKARSHAWAFM